MTFLAPAALGLLALSIPLVVLYMLRSRRHAVEVPSVRLWEGEEEHVSAALPWQRLRITAALLLQLLALALFAFLLARPYFRETTLLGPHTVAIVDTSGSMAMSGRLETATQELTDLVAEASDTQLVSIVEAGPRPRVLAAFSRSPDELAALVADLEVGGGTENLEGALRLARGLATPDRPTTLIFLSDGGTQTQSSEPVSDARHLVFDSAGDNVAITGLGTNPVGEGTPRLFIELASFSGREEVVTVALTVDGLAAGTAEVTLAPGATSRQVMPVDAGPGQVVSAVVSGPGGADRTDANPLDDRADIVLTGAAEVGVSIVGEGSPFLEALIDATPGVALPDERGPDIVIRDGGSAADIDRPSWLLAPETPPPGVVVTGRLEQPVVTLVRPGEPLLDGLDLSELVIAEADIVEAPGWLPIVSAGNVPLVLLGEVDGHRMVYFTFDLVRSNLPVQIAFPILGSRLIDWLAGSRLGTAATAEAGTPIAMTPIADASTRIVLPSGEVRELAADVLEFTATDQPGIYRVEHVDGDGAVVGGFVVSRRFAAGEAAGSSRTIAVEEPTVADTDEASLVREWAPGIIAGLLALVLLEWWVAFGRPRPWRRTRQEGRRRATRVRKAATLGNVTANRKGPA